MKTNIESVPFGTTDSANSVIFKWQENAVQSETKKVVAEFVSANSNNCIHREIAEFASIDYNEAENKEQFLLEKFGLTKVANAEDN